MSDQPADLRPVQVFLDTGRFIELEGPQPFGGGSRDFFKGNDRGFAEHKQRLKRRLLGVAESLRRSRQPAGFLKVTQREEALAKSHRPLGSLFTAANRFVMVGADGVGELLFQATPAALDRLANIVEAKAELTPKLVENKKTGKMEPRASGYRSELGGIDEIRLHGAADRITFSAEAAIRWMEQPNVIGGYLVELFRPDRNASTDAIDHLIAQFRASLERIAGGMLIRPFLPPISTASFGAPTLALSVQLTRGRERYVELPFLPDGRGAEAAMVQLPSAMRDIAADLSVARHAELLSLLAEQVLVRSVDLPPMLETAPSGGGHPTGQANIAPPAAGVDYPTVAIIDGGVASHPQLLAWKVGDAGLVPAADRDETHATFIAGLISGGRQLNPQIAASLEPGGCRFFDLDLFPRHELRNTYYPDVEDLFDTLDEKVKVAKRDHGVRVFNLSFSIGRRQTRMSYSLAADRLDRIARSNDVLFVVAAGNLRAIESRPPWPEKADDAVTMLAGFGSHGQQMTAPSEHVLGLTVGAVNPPGVAGHHLHMPTTYTRRGPGVGGARKPDVAHFGGADSRHANETGLISFAINGDAVHNCGTSFATPLTATTLATLDQRLARQAPRETLLALPIHRARRPEALERPALRHVSREFVGFGITPPADVILNDDPHAMTLVFHDRLLAKQRLEFPFAWPKSLVTDDGACRGRADITLCYTPPIDPDHREEAIRVQLEAILRQEKLIDEETGTTEWQSQLKHDAADVPQGMGKTESYLLKTGLKWTPIKRYYTAMPQGRGNTSNWQLAVESLVRAGVVFPPDGVAFTLLLTISDIKKAAAVREEMRLDLQNRGLVLADITIAHRIRPRSRG